MQGFCGTAASLSMSGFCKSAMISAVHSHSSSWYLPWMLYLCVLLIVLMGLAIAKLWEANQTSRLSFLAQIEGMREQIERLHAAHAAEMQAAEGKAAKREATLTMELAEFQANAHRELTETTARAEVAEVALALSTGGTNDAEEHHALAYHHTMVKQLSFGRDSRSGSRRMSVESYTPLGGASEQEDLCGSEDTHSEESCGYATVPVPLAALKTDSYPMWLHKKAPSTVGASDWESSSRYSDDRSSFRSAPVSCSPMRFPSTPTTMRGLGDGPAHHMSHSWSKQRRLFKDSAQHVAEDEELKIAE